MTYSMRPTERTSGCTNDSCGICGHTVGRDHIVDDQNFCEQCYNYWPPTLMKALSVQGEYQLVMTGAPDDRIHFTYAERHSVEWVIIHWTNQKGADESCEIRVSQIATCGDR